MDCNVQSDELQHWGIRGMKWGIRRYQNKDGSLTPAGVKRYNDEVAKLKKETEKVKAAEKIAANRKKTQLKLDALEEKKRDLEERKKALKSGGKETDNDENSGETLEERKARLLNSNDPRELYKNKDLLTTNELNERINRIDTEARLKSKIIDEPEKSGMDYINEKMNKTSNTLNNATNMFKKIDEAYSTVANSAIGKTLAKKLGIEPPKKERESLDSFLKNIKFKSNKEIQEEAQAQANIKRLNEINNSYKKKADGIKTEKQAKEQTGKQAKEQVEKEAREKIINEAKQQVKDYFNKWQKGESDDSVSGFNTSSGKTSGQKDYTKTIGIGDTVTERYTGPSTIEGEGTSRSTIKQQMDSGNKWWDTTGAKDYSYTEVSNSRSASYGENAISGLLESSAGSSPIAGLLENKD